MFKEDVHATSKDKDTLEASASASAQPSSITKSVYDAATGKKISTGAKADGKKILSYWQKKDAWPYNAHTGEKLPWGTEIDKKNIVPYSHIQNKFPYDAVTGKQLSWGTKIDKKKVITIDTLRKRWPYDAKTAKKLAWGTKVDDKEVISYNNLKDRWPHDMRTGEKLEWGTTGEHVVAYYVLSKRRPVDKYTGKSLPYGTPLGGQVVTRYDFSRNYTFVGSNGETYKGEQAKDKALAEDPILTFESKKEIDLRKRKEKKALDKIKKKEAAALTEQPISSVSTSLDAEPNEIEAGILPVGPIEKQDNIEELLAFITTSPTLDMELDALFEGIDTSVPLVQPQVFMPAYDSTSTTSDSTSAKKSKNHDGDIAFSPTLF